MITLKKDKIKSRVKQITGELLGHDPSELRCHDNFTEKLGADSLDCLEISMQVETAFSVEISGEEIEKFKTIGDVVDYVDAIVNPIGI